MNKPSITILGKEGPERELDLFLSEELIKRRFIDPLELETCVEEYGIGLEAGGRLIVKHYCDDTVSVYRLSPISHHHMRSAN